MLACIHVRLRCTYAGAHARCSGGEGLPLRRAAPRAQQLRESRLPLWLETAPRAPKFYRPHRSAARYSKSTLTRPACRARIRSWRRRSPGARFRDKGIGSRCIRAAGANAELEDPRSRVAGAIIARIHASRNSSFEHRPAHIESSDARPCATCSSTTSCPRSCAQNSSVGGDVMTRRARIRSGGCGRGILARRLPREYPVDGGRPSFVDLTMRAWGRRCRHLDVAAGDRGSMQRQLASVIEATASSTIHPPSCGSSRRCARCASSYSGWPAQAGERPDVPLNSRSSTPSVYWQPILAMREKARCR